MAKYCLDDAKCKHEAYGKEEVYNKEQVDERFNNCAEKVLYDNSNGSNGAITLSETSANFKYLEIFFVDIENNCYNSQKVYSPNSKSICLSTMVPFSNGSGTTVYRTKYTISENKITLGSRDVGYFQVKEDYIVWSSMSNGIKITRVVGYK